MISRYLFPLLVFTLVLTFPVKAQIQLGGLADFELRKGGSDSSPYINQTPNDKWLVYTPYIRLFANANISENWFVSSALQSDYYNDTGLSAPFFSVINLNWLPNNNSDFTVTAGRFVTPYGAYSDRVLSSENPFVHLPLTHSSGLPVSQQFGILADTVDYGEYVTGLTMMYQRMYSQGISFNNQIGESNIFQYNLAATFAPASGYFETAQHNMPSFSGRLTIQPKIWGRLGLSFSTGPFLYEDAVTDISDSDLASFRQTLFGTDLMVSYHYYSFLVEYNWSRWKAPYIDGMGTIASEGLKTSVSHISAEAVVDLPFLVGTYTGLRYETLISGDIASDTGGYGSDETWTYNRERVEFLVGYKLHRNITMKASYLYATDSGPDLNDDVLAIQLSVAY